MERSGVVLRAFTPHWVVRALLAAVAGFNSGCSVTPVSVRETSRQPTVHGETANLRGSPANSGRISSEQIAEKAGDNLWDAVFTVRPERLVVSKDALTDLGDRSFSNREKMSRMSFLWQRRSVGAI